MRFLLTAIQRWKRLALIAVLIWLVYVIWPVLGFVPLLFQENLIVITNEAETRPCGGFVSAFGQFSILPPRANFHNSYAMGHRSMGPALEPISQVAGELKFWDLGLNVDPMLCAKRFREGFGEDIDRVILLDLGTIEELFRLAGSISIDGESVSAENMFATLSRVIANVDRHDEDSLASRKAPLGTAGKKVIGNLLLRPWKWHQLTHTLKRRMKAGHLFVEHLSPERTPQAQDFIPIEWNLGGAKSSRYLHKTLHVSIREVAPERWKTEAKIIAQHRGGIDEPLSQDWKGRLELRWPEVLGGGREVVDTVIEPGDSFEKSWTADFQGDLSEAKMGIFIPRSQTWHVESSIELFPQKTFADATFQTHENVGEVWKRVTGEHLDLFWESSEDKTGPFVTLHTFVSPDYLHEEAQTLWQINPETWRDEDLLAEIHFNEPVIIDPSRFEAQFQDRDIAKGHITDDPQLRRWHLASDQRTLLLQLERSVSQPNERYFLTLGGVSDLWENDMQGGQRTLIER